MNVYCIVCSRKKRETTSEIEAVDLYLSPHIKAVYELSKKDGLEFRILSGKFGLLRATDKIQNYNYLLRESDVESLKDKIKKQITEQRIESLTFFAENREEHPNWTPYYNSIIKACDELGIGLELVEIRDPV